jgi:hypothetical protein
LKINVSDVFRFNKKEISAPGYFRLSTAFRTAGRRIDSAVLGRMQKRRKSQNSVFPLPARISFPSGLLENAEQQSGTVYGAWIIETVPVVERDSLFKCGSSGRNHVIPRYVIHNGTIQ